jgi:uncharacterized membrane protein
MEGLPLHPVLVHVPIGIAAILPLVLIHLLWSQRRGALPAGAWWIGVGLAALMAAGAVAAARTGEAEEHRVEKIVPASAMEAHEDAAEGFQVAAITTAALALLGALVKAAAPSASLRSLALAGSIVALALVVRAGHAGGLLVYEHNAGAAYRKPPSGASLPPPPGAERPSRGRDDGR